MKKALFKALKIILPLGLGAFLIYYSLSQFTDEQLDEIKSYLIDADYSWIVLGVILALLSHLSRAWRWNYMLKAIGHKPTYITNVLAIGAGYAMNLLIPRSGEVARAVVVNRIDNIPVDKAIGTIIAERVLDFIILLFITATALLISGDLIIDFFVERLNSAFAKADTSTITLYAIIIGVAIILLLLLLKFFKPFKKIKNFISGLKDGFQTIWTMEQKWLYLAHTIFIWSMYLLMFYVSIFALPGTNLIPVSGILSAFVAGSFAVAFTNGGFGAYPYFIAQVLILFGVAETLGTSLGWILWTSQTALVLVYGLVSFLMLAIKNSLSAK
ncbi:MAG: lysylphosphatidylglycerol synthase transmembrane domain-containing protein [Nonlabens sp.]|uniref:lysylphosphatidylglycerol synthase transmembrane domain-containing protein n=1 Tax=Nonlabens sp. TaxID=1888209 RepID=UPI003EF321BF